MYGCWCAKVKDPFSRSFGQSGFSSVVAQRMLSRDPEPVVSVHSNIKKGFTKGGKAVVERRADKGRGALSVMEYLGKYMEMEPIGMFHRFQI